MSRRRQLAALTVVTLVVAGASATGAVAKAKPKMKTMKGSYQVTLVPDPTIEVEGQLGKDCANVDPKSIDVHALNLPGTGTLNVVLDSPDPTGKGKTDWDLVLLDKSGAEYDSSHGETSHEELSDPGLKKGKVSIVVCNLIGEPNATVTYSYTYK